MEFTFREIILFQLYGESIIIPATLGHVKPEAAGSVKTP